MSFIVGVCVVVAMGVVMIRLLAPAPARHGRAAARPSGSIRGSTDRMRHGAP